MTGHVGETKAFAGYRLETLARMRERVQEAGLVYGGKPSPEIGGYVGALTTGIRDGYQVVELAVLSARGVPKTVRFRPTVDVEAAAFALHGLSREALEGCAALSAQLLDELLPKGLIVGWAGDFIGRGLTNSGGGAVEVFDLQGTISDPYSTYPVADAALDALVDLPPRTPESALRSAVRTRALLHQLAGEPTVAAH